MKEEGLKFKQGSPVKFEKEGEKIKVTIKT